MKQTRRIFALLAVAILCYVATSHAAPQGEKKIEQMKETGEFTPATARDKVKTDCPGKGYALNCVAGRTYTIDLRSEEFDAYLRLEDANGRTVKEDDDSGGGKNNTDARMVFKADKSGPHTIVATAYHAAAKGKYTLTVTHDGLGSEKEITYVIDVKAKLTKDDPKDKDRGGDKDRVISYYKAFKIDMKAKTTYVIQLDSREFDAYLRLLDSSGKEVANDDDGAKDGLNAKLIFACDKAGQYTIIATTFAHADTGDFHLRVYAKE